jgi:hypothetical protein
VDLGSSWDAFVTNLSDPKPNVLLSDSGGGFDTSMDRLVTTNRLGTDSRSRH